MPDVEPFRGRDCRWDELHVAELGAWTPTELVSVVVGPGSEDALASTMAGLDHQTYPSELMQIVVAGRPAATPPAPAAPMPEHVDQAWGEDTTAGAMNEAVSGAEGSILVLLSAGTVPEPRFVEAHARWHHEVADAVSIGRRAPVEHRSFTPNEVQAAARDDALASLLDDETAETPAAEVGLLLRTDDLRRPATDAFLAAAYGDLGLRTATFDALGGLDASLRPLDGGNVELAARASAYGCLLVPEPAALSWHLDAGSLDAELVRLGRLRLLQRVTDRAVRAPRPGSSYRVPRWRIELLDGPADGLEATIASLLADEVGDLAIHLPDDVAEHDRRLLDEAFGSDARLRAADDDARAASLFTLRIPHGLSVSPSTLRSLEDELTRDGAYQCALVRCVVETAEGPRTVEAWATRARARFRRLRPGDEVAEAEARRATRWVSARASGIVAGSIDTAPEGEDVQTTSGGADELRELWTRLAGLPEHEREQVVRAARGVLRLPARQRRLLLRVGRVLRLVR